MYKRILVPTDGSPMSEKAVEGAARFAKSLGASLVIITVVEPYSYTNLSEYRPESIEQYDERVTAEAEDRLAGAKRRCDELGVPSSTLMVKSFSPAEAIIEQSKKHDCDVVFMASHGTSGLRCRFARLRNSESAHAFPDSRHGLPLIQRLPDGFVNRSEQLRYNCDAVPPAWSGTLLMEHDAAGACRTAIRRDLCPHRTALMP